MPAPVVVIHDDLAVREQIVNALHGALIDAVSFSDPMQALDAIEASDQVRVVVTRIDFGTGRLNGIALARMVKLKQPMVEVVFVGRPQNAEHIKGDGEFVPLPLDPQALVEAVRGRLAS